MRRRQETGMRQPPAGHAFVLIFADAAGKLRPGSNGCVDKPPVETRRHGSGNRDPRPRRARTFKRSRLRMSIDQARACQRRAVAGKRDDDESPQSTRSASTCAAKAPSADKGLEVCYVEGRNQGMMRVHPAGCWACWVSGRWIRTIRRAFEKNRHCITEAGLGNLLESTARYWDMERRLNKTHGPHHGRLCSTARPACGSKRFIPIGSAALSTVIAVCCGWTR